MPDDYLRQLSQIVRTMSGESGVFRAAVLPIRLFSRRGNTRLVRSLEAALGLDQVAARTAIRTVVDIASRPLTFGRAHAGTGPTEDELRRIISKILEACKAADDVTLSQWQQETVMLGKTQTGSAQRGESTLRWTDTWRARINEG